MARMRSGAMDPDDKRDFTDRFNTTLSPKDEQNFQIWMTDQSQKIGRDVSKDLYDYDLRGWWKDTPNASMSDTHLTDDFKKPNHPTFSIGSRYNGAEGMQGGVWGKKPDGSWTFRPGSTNVYSRDELQDYFRRVEPGNTLIVPGIH